MLLSIIIPARNEAGNLPSTLGPLQRSLAEAGIHHELIVVDDGSTDDTPALLRSLSQRIPQVRGIRNEGRHGFGMAVRCGLDVRQGDAVAIVMADGSDDPQDLVRFFKEFEKGGCDCVFGTRFHPQSVVRGYPRHKRVLNRLVNKFIQILFALKYNDVTNAFKLYGTHVIEGVKPVISPHFNLTVELPLKAIVRGFKFRVLPNNWYGRKNGESKLKLKEMGSRYLFIILYCFIEKWLSRGDYLRETAVDRPQERSTTREA